MGQEQGTSSAPATSPGPESLPWGEPRAGGAPAPVCSLLQRLPVAQGAPGPPKRSQHMDVPQHHSQEEEEHIPTPVAAQARIQMSTLHPLSEGRGVGVTLDRLPAPLQTGKAPSREGKSSALLEMQETPLSQGSSWTVRFKELFHSGKRKARVEKKSAGQCRGDPSSRGPAQRALSRPLSPKPCRISSLRRDPSPHPSTDPPSSQKDPPHTGTGWEPGPHPDPSAGSRARSPFPCPQSLI